MSRFRGRPVPHSVKGTLLIETPHRRSGAEGELRRLLPGVARVELLLQQLARVEPGAGPMVEAWNRRGGVSHGPPSSLPAEAQRYLPRFLALVPPRDRREARVSALRDYQSLLRVETWEERRRSVARARHRFGSPALVGLLLAAGKDEIHDDPHEAEHFARLAKDVAGRGHAAAFRVCRVMGLAHQGNAKRAAGDLRGAELLLVQALDLLFSAPPPYWLKAACRQVLDSASYQLTGDRPTPEMHGLLDQAVLRAGAAAHPPAGWFQAELFSLLGSLRKDQRRLQEALDLLDRARRLFIAAEDKTGTARVRLVIAAEHRLNGRHEQAVAEVSASLPLIDRKRHPRLLLWAYHNLALYLCEMGRIQMVEILLSDLAPLYRRFGDRQTYIRRRWLEGLLAKAQGDPAGAQQHLTAVVEELVREGTLLQAAVAALDLACLLFEQGSYRDLQRLASQLPTIFRQGDVHCEAHAAALLFAKAAAEQEVSSAFLEELRGYFVRGQRGAAERFESRTLGGE